LQLIVTYITDGMGVNKCNIIKYTYSDENDNWKTPIWKTDKSPIGKSKMDN